MAREASRVRVVGPLGPCQAGFEAALTAQVAIAFFVLALVLGGGAGSVAAWG